MQFDEEWYFGGTEGSHCEPHSLQRKKSDKKQSGRLFISSVNTSPTIMLLLYVKALISFHFLEIKIS